jgi:phosphatidylserine decarboxylase
MVRFGECWAVLLVLIVALLPTYLAAPVLVVVPTALIAFTLYFFRDPERNLPAGQGILVSPADGRVLDIEEVDDPWVGKGRRLSIFMSPFDVHVNRAPFDCTIKSIRHTPGKKVAAYFRGDLDARERNRIEVEGTCRMACEQYAGVVARRIVCWMNEGESIKIGQRIGMIKFGSRVDVLAPLNVEFKVGRGERLIAGETVIGVLNG